MTRKYLIQQIKNKRSYLCVGLDTNIEKIPVHLQSKTNGVFEFNKQIIDATRDLCVAYKINTAFYEANGVKGWKDLEKTVNYIPSTHFKIADAKRGDIGNTSYQYAKAFFETIPFDAITVAPYMGRDSLQPFLDYKKKWTIVLGLTSNAGAQDFELQQIMLGNTGIVTEAAAPYNSYQTFEGTYLYEKVIFDVRHWGSSDNLMFVVGATKANEIQSIRKMIPDYFLLIPGVGFQGGNLSEVSKYGLNKDCGLLVNVSRAIIYAGKKENFAEEGRQIALQYQTEMKGYL